MFRGSEEEAAPASDRTMDGVHESKFEDSWEEDPQQNNIDVASGHPPNNVQPIKMQQIIPQQTDQDQHNNSTQLSTTKSDPMKGQAAEVLMKKLKKEGYQKKTGLTT